MIFGKYINRYYLRSAPVLLLGLLALLTAALAACSAMVLGLVLCYAFGTFWFLTVYTGGSGETLLGALTLCVFPYVRRWWSLPICGSGCLTTAASCPSNTTRSTRSAT